MTSNLMKVSSQGVREFPVDHKQKLMKNEDIDDVYDHPISREGPHFDTNKETVSKPATKTKRKRRIANKNHSMDFGADVFSLPSRDYVQHQYNTDLNDMHDDEKIDFIEKENKKLMDKVYALSEGLKGVLQKMKEKKESKPPQVFIHQHEEFAGMLI
jgi:hypothetical protein